MMIRLPTPGISSQLLIIVLIQTMTVQSASHRDIENGPKNNFDFLLDELHGTNLRLSFTVVCKLFSHSYIAVFNWFFLLQEPPWSTELRDSNGTIVTYKGYIVDIADYMAKALNIT